MLTLLRCEHNAQIIKNQEQKRAIHENLKCGFCDNSF